MWTGMSGLKCSCHALVMWLSDFSLFLFQHVVHPGNLLICGKPHFLCYPNGSNLCLSAWPNAYHFSDTLQPLTWKCGPLPLGSSLLAILASQRCHDDNAQIPNVIIPTPGSTSRCAGHCNMHRILPGPLCHGFSCGGQQKQRCNVEVRGNWWWLLEATTICWNKAAILLVSMRSWEQHWYMHRKLPGPLRYGFSHGRRQ